MLKVIDLITSLRFSLGDMQGLSISDYELIEAINQAANPKAWIRKYGGHIRGYYMEAELKELK